MYTSVIGLRFMMEYRLDRASNLMFLETVNNITLFTVSRNMSGRLNYEYRSRLRVCIQLIYGHFIVPKASVRPYCIPPSGVARCMGFNFKG